MDEKQLAPSVSFKLNINFSYEFKNLTLSAYQMRIMVRERMIKLIRLWHRQGFKTESDIMLYYLTIPLS